MSVKYRVVAATLSAMIALTACRGGGDHGSTTIEAYAAGLNVIEIDFAEDVEALGPPDSGDGFPLEAQLVFATNLYELSHRRLDRWKGLTPPDPDVAAYHEQLVAAYTAVQQEVGDYLNHAALEREEFDFSAISSDPGVFAALARASTACRAIEQRLRDAGHPAAFAFDCQF